jgi:hypothetical protein
MRNVWSAWIVFCTLVAAIGCWPPSPDWNGTWKLNPTKSTYQGNVLTISISGDGEYRFDESSSHTLRCDGKDRPIGNNRTQVCVKSGDTVLDIAILENGVKTRSTHDEVATDGKSFTTTVTEFRPNGSVITSQIVFLRLSGDNGFAGRWRDTSYLQQYADMTLRLDNQTLHIDYPVADQHIDARLSGVDSAASGPHVLGGTTFAARPAGSREFLIVTKHQSKLFSQGSLKLSEDGRVITETSWNPDRPDDKVTLVYGKR